MRGIVGGKTSCHGWWAPGGRGRPGGAPTGSFQRPVRGSAGPGETGDPSLDRTSILGIGVSGSARWSPSRSAPSRTPAPGGTPKKFSAIPGFQLRQEMGADHPTRAIQTVVVGIVPPA